MGRSSLARLTVLMCLALLATPGLAKTVKVTATHPVAIVDIPDTWKVLDTKRGFRVKSPDEEVFFWIETFTPDQRAGVVAEHESYFMQQGVEITGDPEVSTKDDRTVSMKSTHLPATWKGKPTVLRYLLIDLHLPSQTQILLSYWASPEGDEEHDAAMDKIIASFTPLAQ
jgi:hypothetical protein